MKQNETFVHETYLNLAPYLFLLKKIEAFQLILKLKFLSFMTKVNSNNVNETKSDIIHGTYSNLALFFVVRKILKYFNNFFNWHLSVSVSIS